LNAALESAVTAGISLVRHEEIEIPDSIVTMLLLGPKKRDAFVGLHCQPIYGEAKPPKSGHADSDRRQGFFAMESWRFVPGRK
jgi:hypothetical protein